jgi:hypothetical protein
MGGMGRHHGGRTVFIPLSTNDFKFTSQLIDNSSSFLVLILPPSSLTHEPFFATFRFLEHMAQLCDDDRRSRFPGGDDGQRVVGGR